MKKIEIIILWLVSITLYGNATTLQYDGWNLIGVCQDINRADIDMTGIYEIQDQNGSSIYTGSDAQFTNLHVLKAGYGYWIKGDIGINFESGETTKRLVQPLRRDNWNLMASCEDTAQSDINMTGITELQSQKGEILYTGDWAKHSTLHNTVNGYGYWVQGNKETLWMAKSGPAIPPTLGDSTFTIAEDTVSGSTIGTLNIVNEGDDEISAITLSGTGSEQFTVAVDGTLTLTSNAVLDYETTEVYTLKAVATNGAGDSNSVNVTINITNVIDNVPVLATPSSSSVAEDIAVGTEVVTITTNGSNSDENQVDSYTIIDGNVDAYFTISDAGVISTAKALDYEHTTSYTLQVKATNSAGDSETVDVVVAVINIADVVPTLVNSTATVVENTVAGTKIGKVIITDTGDSAIKTVTLNGTGKDNFSVSSDGSITVKSGAILDYETTPSYSLTVVATNDAGNSNSVSLTVTVTNVIDNVPVLATPSSSSVSENLTVGSEVVTIHSDGANSDQNQVDSFTIVSGNTNSDFAISNMGVITTIKSLDYERTTGYTLKVKATNSAGDSATVDVVISLENIIDNPPVIVTPEAQSVKEDVPVGTEIVTISSSGSNSDENEIDSFTIASGNTNSDFTISDTGVITTAKPLDYERTTSYTLQVKATNSAGDSTAVDIVINVIDVVDIDPRFIYQTINNSSEAVETTYGDYTIKIFTNYEESVNPQSNHVGIVVNVNGGDAPLMSIQSTYIGHEIIVAVYDTNGVLVGVSDIVTLENRMIIKVTTVEDPNANVMTVSNTQELRDALEVTAANGENDIIVLNQGVYKTTEDGLGTFTYSSSEDYSLTIKSANGLSRDDVVLDGDNTHRVLTVNGKNVVLKNLTVSNGLNDRGAGIYQSNLTTLESCNVIYNHATRTGGGIYVGGKVIVKDSNISYNKAEATSFGSDPDGQGGGIYGGYENQFIEVYDSILSHNFANKQGGAIGSAYGANIRVIDSILSYNKVKRDPASSWGGNGAAISGYESTLVIVNSKIFKNENIDDTGSYNSNIGGTINSYISSGNEYYDDNRYLMIINSVISDNINGGIRGNFTDQRMILLFNSTITNNTNYGVDGRMLFINNIFNNETTDIKLSTSSSLYNNYFDSNKVVNPSNMLIDSNNIDASSNSITFIDSDYRLPSNSPTVDRGLNPEDEAFKGLFTEAEYQKVMAMMQTDKDGNTRVINGIIDMGAYESSDSTYRVIDKPTLITDIPESTYDEGLVIDIGGEPDTSIYVNGEYVTEMMDSGSANLILNMPEVGEYTFSIMLRDQFGNESEPLVINIKRELNEGDPDGGIPDDGGMLDDGGIPDDGGFEPEPF